MAKKMQKTNVMRVLDAAKIKYTEYTFEGEYSKLLLQWESPEKTMFSWCLLLRNLT